MKEYPVTIFYLELTSDEWAETNMTTGTSISFYEVDHSEIALARDLYMRVGREWYWTDRYDWSLGKWRDRVCESNVSLWVMQNDIEILGYYELELCQNDVEVSYFGLLPDAIGKGFGKYMLEDVFRRSFHDLNACRVWLHTCTLDHHQALPNYQSRGMQIYKKESHVQYIPDGWDIPTDVK